jgi:hypothetical protein
MRRALIVGAIVVAVMMVPKFMQLGDDTAGDGSVSTTPPTSLPSPSPTIPDVTGQQFADARASLSPSVAVTPSGTPSLSANDPTDTILEQSPTAGTTYEPSTTPTIHVVLSIHPVKVPNLVGLSLTRAKELLTDRHLKPVVLKKQSTGTKWAVLKQGVSTGKGVGPGTKVKVVVVYPHVCGYPLNPWCFSVTSGGSVVYSPPATLCDYLNCISSFWSSTNGYVIQCADGEFSHSGGVSGSCSSHGGNWRPLYS